MPAYYNEFDKKTAAWLRQLISDGHVAPGDVDERDIKDVTPDDIRHYTQCHFFAGIGGWSLALRIAGWADGRPVWTGSCPCQPFSTAGKGLGNADERHLWPVFFDLIRECRSERVIGEQVASAIGKGWLDGISADLEAAGYACGATVLGAHSVGAPHIRQRLFWVADAGRGSVWCDGTARDIYGPSRRVQSKTRQQRVRADGGNGRSLGWLADGVQGGREMEVQHNSIGHEAGRVGEAGVLGSGSAACGLGHTLNARLEVYAGHGDNSHQPGRIDANQAGSVAAPSCDSWGDYTIIPCGDGKSRRIESGLAPLAHGVPARVVRLRGYGNAIVPQVAAAFIEAVDESLADLAVGGVA